jgi:hypothetical protein
MRKLILLLFFSVAVQAQTHPLRALMEAARTNSPALKRLFATTVFDLKEKGAAAVGSGFSFCYRDRTDTNRFDRQTTPARDDPRTGFRQLANSLKLRGYDFYFRFGEGMHANAQAALDLPDSLIWLWREYDPAKTEQTYEMEPNEREKPLYGVRIANRDAW